MSPNIHIAQENTTGRADALQHEFSCVMDNNTHGCLAVASLTLNKTCTLLVLGNEGAGCAIRDTG